MNQTAAETRIYNLIVLDESYLPHLLFKITF